MAAYNGVVSVISSNLDSKTYADTYTHTSKAYLGKLSVIYPEIEHSIPPAPVPEAMYQGIYNTEITNWIENKKLVDYYPAPTPPPPPIDVALDTVFSGNIENFNVADILTVGTHTNMKRDGVIFPRLYDWTGVNHGTFR